MIAISGTWLLGAGFGAGWIEDYCYARDCGGFDGGGDCGGDGL